jgi:hypothetical protein
MTRHTCGPGAKSNEQRAWPMMAQARELDRPEGGRTSYLAGARGMARRIPGNRTRQGPGWADQTEGRGERAACRRELGHARATDGQEGTGTVIRVRGVAHRGPSRTRTADQRRTRARTGRTGWDRSTDGEYERWPRRGRSKSTAAGGDLDDRWPRATRREAEGELCWPATRRRTCKARWRRERTRACDGRMLIYGEGGRNEIVVSTGGRREDMYIGIAGPTSTPPVAVMHCAKVKKLDEIAITATKGATALWAGPRSTRPTGVCPPGPPTSATWAVGRKRRAVDGRRCERTEGVREHGAACRTRASRRAVRACGG